MGKVTKRLARKNKEIKECWDDKKSVLNNLADMGLSADPNKTLHIKSTKELITPMEMDISEIKKINKKPVKESVVKALEQEANIPAAKTNKLSEPEVMYCTYMMDKYGDDYKAMARDPRNHYQETPKQIKKKINMFKNTGPQYAAYLKSKGKAK
ncbi:NOP16-like protein [Mya arenaria]|uniref:Nucleolar protein 16 n=1 Tax=Mya arenaria TaxID=6604 RepID=A0ABY7FP14_MYAAR|nr:NOP16-like protein [Mya arenaria]WAR22594.1 NOP16-like protein [Mya arenaria]